MHEVILYIQFRKICSCTFSTPEATLLHNLHLILGVILVGGFGGEQFLTFQNSDFEPKQWGRVLATFLRIQDREIQSKL